VTARARGARREESAAVGRQRVIRSFHESSAGATTSARATPTALASMPPRVPWDRRRFQNASGRLAVNGCAGSACGGRGEGMPLASDRVFGRFSRTVSQGRARTLKDDWKHLAIRHRTGVRPITEPGAGVRKNRQHAKHVDLRNRKGQEAL